MDSLTFRAEQALLGAMLAEPQQVSTLDYLESDDFASRRNAIVFSAVWDASLGWEQGDRRWERTIAMAIWPDVPPTYLDELHAACPDCLNAPAYGDLVLEASVRRKLVGHADRLDRDIDDLSYHAWRQAQADTPEALSTASHAQHMGEVAKAIRGHAAAFDPDSVTSVTGPSRVAASGPAQEEERFLAALIADDFEALRVLHTVPEEVFTDPLRRSVFRVIAAMHASDQAIDALTVDWELARLLPHQEQNRVAESLANATPGYIARLAGIDTRTIRIEETVSAILLQHARMLHGQRRLVNGVSHGEVPGVPVLPSVAPAQSGVTPDQPGPRLIQPPPGLPDQGPGRTQRM